MTVARKQQTRRSEIRSHGVRLPLPNHEAVRRLKRVCSPSNHGHKVWPTTWLLIDYLKKTGVADGSRVLDLACGWGLPGVFCARVFNAGVTWIDGDGAVYPYLELLAEMNGIEPRFIPMDLDKVGKNILKDIDIVIASDICFCDTLIDPIRRFIHRAKRASVSQILISDPGRWPFDDLTDLFINRKGTTLTEWTVTEPVSVEGKIFKMSFPAPM